MCIRDSIGRNILRAHYEGGKKHDIAIVAVNDLGNAETNACLLYTSDAADERSSVDLGGRRIIKNKNKRKKNKKQKKKQPYMYIIYT